MRRFSPVLFTCTLLFQAGLLSSQESVSGEEPAREVYEIWAEADQENESLPAVPSRIITREEIQASGARNGAEALEKTPGLVLTRYGGRGQGMFVSLRGSSTDQVLILVNGQRINTDQGAAVDLSLIPAGDLERIEIIRSGQTAAFGPGAFAGIINLVTRPSGDTPEAAVTLTTWYPWSQEGSAALSGPLPGASQWKLSGFLQGLWDRGDFGYFSENYGKTLPRENAGTISGVLRLRAEWDKAPGLRGWMLEVSQSAGRRGVPGQEGLLSPRALLEDQGTLAQSVFNFPAFAPWMPGELTLGGGVRGRSFSPDFQTAGMDRHETRSLSASWQGQMAGTAGPVNWRVTGKTGGAWEDLVSTALVRTGGQEGSGQAERASGTGSLGFLTEWKEMGIVLSPWVRWDGVLTKNSAEQDSVLGESTWSAALAWAPSGSGITWKLSGGRNIMLPSFDDLFWITTGFAMGNPDLKPEVSLDLEGGLDWNRSLGSLSLGLGAAGFLKEVRDLIHWTPGAGGVWRPRNLGLVTIIGGEGEIRALWEIPGWQGYLESQGQMSLLRAANQDPSPALSGRQLPYRPFLTASGEITFRSWDAWSLQLSALFMGPRYTNEGNTQYLDSYLVLDAACRLTLTEEWTLGLAVRNLLNTPYLSREYYPVPGLEAGLSLEWSAHHE